MLAIGTAGIEVAQQLFLKCKIKGKHVNLFDLYHLGKYAVMGPSGSETMPPSGVRRRKTHYCAEAICSPTLWPCGAQ